jgi:neutral ceramidase
MNIACRLVVLLAGLLAAGQPPSEFYRVGIGRVDITPEGPTWLAGYGDRKKPSEGVEQHLFTKALAIRHGDDPPAMLITADIIGFPRRVAESIAGRIASELKVPRERVMLVASHTHTGPVIAGRPVLMFDLESRDLDAVTRFTRELENKCFRVAQEALLDVRPARVSFGRGTATFAVNRRVFRAGGVDFGVNRDGPVDHSVSVLRIDGADGQPRAIIFGYACHCTTLTGECYRISGDWAGYAEDYLERAHPGATAFFITGCGADANPQPRGDLALAREHGLEMAGAVAQVMKGQHIPVAGPITAVFERVELLYAKPPTREEYERRLKDKSPFIRRHARAQIETIDRGGKLPSGYPCPVQAWQFGKGLTLAALGGEVVVDYALRLKREFAGRNLWVAAYANDVFAYVPSVRILIEGGYEADYNLIYYGLPTRFSNDVEEVLIKKVHELIEKASR